MTIPGRRSKDYEQRAFIAGLTSGVLLGLVAALTIAVCAVVVTNAL